MPTDTYMHCTSLYRPALTVLQWCGTPGYQDEPKYRDTCPDACGKPRAPAIANAPYYGMLLVQQAIAGAGQGAGVRLYGVSGGGTSSVAYMFVKVLLLLVARRCMLRQGPTGGAGRKGPSS